MKKYLMWIPAILFVFGILSWVYNHDQSLARTTTVLQNREEIKLIHKRYEDDKKYKRAEKIEKRIWWYERTYPNNTIPQADRTEYENLKQELQRLRREGY